MIEFEYWQLLLFPLFFALGWAAARIDIRHLVKESRSLPRSYFQGLNFLLNEQPDRAIESFMDAVKVDPQTVELHFALGSLFRRRGETERAIRMPKLKQKISGAFRSDHGADTFCTVRSYLATLRKQGTNLFQAIQATFRGKPTPPVFDTG